VFTVIIQKLNNSPLGKSECPLHIRRKRDKSSYMKNIFSAVKALLMRNLFLQAKQLTSATTGRFRYVLAGTMVDLLLVVPLR